MWADRAQARVGPAHQPSAPRSRRWQFRLGWYTRRDHPRCFAQVAHQRKALGTVRIGGRVVDGDRLLAAERADQRDLGAAQQHAGLRPMRGRQRDPDGGREVEGQLAVPMRFGQRLDDPERGGDRVGLRGRGQEDHELGLGGAGEHAVAGGTADASADVGPHLRRPRGPWVVIWARARYRLSAGRRAPGGLQCVLDRGFR